MKLKPRVLSVIALIMFATLLIIFGMKANTDSLVQESSPDTQEGVMAWLSAFTNRDYSTCDKLIKDSSDKLYSAEAITLMSDETYYKVTLDKLVDCISAIQVKKIIKDTDTGITEYTVSVTYTPYYALGDLVYDKDALENAKIAFENEELSDADFQSELSRVYYDIFINSCFQDGNLDARQQDLILSEKEKNGVASVYGTVNFVDGLLSDSNISRNLSIYESNVKSVVKRLIQQ